MRKPATPAPTKTPRPGDQPLPIPNDLPDAQSMVIADVEARKQIGIERYGTALQPFNGRSTIRDAYEEALDLAIYLRAELAERDHLNAAVARLTAQLAIARAALRCLSLNDELDAIAALDPPDTR